MEYSEKVIDHFTNPRNIGKLEDANATATEGSPACGDQVSFFLKINEESQIIEDIRFLSYGCASNIATASITTEMVKGNHISTAKKLDWKKVTEVLDGLPPVKIHCSVLAVDCLKNAIKNYELQRGYIEPEPFGKATILNELKSVIYPIAGEDIITLKMLKYLSFDNGTVHITLDLPKFCTHKENVIYEIKEHLEKFSEIKDIIFIDN